MNFKHLRSFCESGRKSSGSDVKNIGLFTADSADDTDMIFAKTDNSFPPEGADGMGSEVFQIQGIGGRVVL